MTRGRLRLLTGVLLSAMLPALAGCFPIEVSAPYGSNVRVLPSDVPVEVTRRQQMWFAIWGIFPLSGKDPREIIAEERLAEARVYTEDSVEDAVAGFFYMLLYPSGIIVPQTYIVEGNRLPVESVALPKVP
jgi:hypothetical protein